MQVGRPWSGVEEDRDALRSYFREIASIATLSREQEVDLASRYRRHTDAWRAQLLGIPFTARAALERWQAIRQDERVTSTLSASYRDRSGVDPGPALDAAMEAVERTLARRDRRARAGAAEADLAALDRALACGLARADLVMRVLEEILEELRALHAELAATRPGSAARRTLERRAGLAAPALGQRLAALSAEREESLRLKQRFVQHNLKLVVSLAKELRGRGVAFTDLVQEGNLGLIRAVEKFDPAQGCKFSTYAVWWIWQACVRALQIHSRTVRLPSQVHDQLLKHHRVSMALERRLGREPGEEETAAGMGIEVDEMRRILSAQVRTWSLDAPLHEGEARPVQDVVADPAGARAPEEIDRAILQSRLEALLAPLDPRERTVLLFRFGLAGQDERTLQQIGESLGLSRERVRQIETQALARLRFVASGLGLRSLVDGARPASRVPPRARAARPKPAPAARTLGVGVGDSLSA